MLSLRAMQRRLQRLDLGHVLGLRRVHTRLQLAVELLRSASLMVEVGWR